MPGRRVRMIGLWLGDGYLRSSTVGLTNTDVTLILEFREFLKQVTKKCPAIVAYVPPSKYPKLPVIKRYSYFKGSRVLYKVYVNSRKAVKIFRRIKEKAKRGDLKLRTFMIPEYLLGRYLGDGNFEKRRIRIFYGYKEEAEMDLKYASLFGRASLNFYRKSNEYCLNIWKSNLMFWYILRFSMKRAGSLQSRRQPVP